MTPGPDPVPPEPAALVLGGATALVPGPHAQPVHDLAATLVHSARSADVVATVVDGRVLMRERELLTVDLDDVLARLRPRVAALADRSHGARLQTYAP